ncbi:sulfate transporter [Nannochloropsis gaditana]|uniref:Sulfate transporter n=1 Tax=Nannochloropsis gaditana TaxID=72520 RepID=W7TG36_9STRA|nr:sulfate transporter [Nannochloropsis gaditana]
MLGINVPSFRYTFQTLRYITFHLSSTNPWELLIGIPVLVLVSGVAAWKKRPPTGTSWDRFGRRLAIALPLLVVLYSTILAYHLYERHHLPIKLSYAHKGRYEVGVDQELSALGLSNMVGSCFGGFVAVSSYARASVNYEAGGRTQMSALVASTLVIVVVQWLSPAFYYVPMSGLAALLCGALVSSFTVQPFFETYRSSPRDFFVLVATSIVMFVVSVDTGIYSGIGLSICNLLLQYSYPDLEELGRLSGAPGKWRAVKRYRHAVTPRNIRVLRLDEALTFVNGDFVTGLLLRAAKTMEAEAKGLSGPEASMPHVVKTAPHMTSLTVVCACTHVRGHGNTTRDWMPGCQETLGSEGVQRGSAGWTSPTATTIQEMESQRVALPDDNRTDSLASRCLPFQRKRKDGDGREAKKCCHLFIVLDASGINFMDFSGLRALGKVAKDMRDHGVRLLIAQAKSRLQDMLQTAPTLYHDVGGDKIKLSLEDLVYLLERHEMRLHGSLFASTREDGNKPQKVAAGC